MTRRPFSWPHRCSDRHPSLAMARAWWIAAGLLLVLGSPATAADPITQWNEFLLNLNSTVTPPATATLRGPNAATVDLAYVHIAMYDAVNAIEGGYTPFAVKLSNVPPGASPEAAAAAAAYTVLVNKVYTPVAFPSVQAQIAAQYASALAQIPDGQPKTDGIAVGQAVATGLIALRANDGLNASVPYTFLPPGPGVYQQTPGPPPTFAYAGPVTPWMAKLKPFAIRSPSQFRADGPPSLTSKQWAEDLNEVKAYGAAMGSLRTLEQDQIGLFYAENAAFQVGRTLRNLAAVQELTFAEDARFFAQAYVTMADTFIGCWDSKYHYNFWRPVTAVRQADTDGNDATEPDPTWSPQLVTPGHPEYPSAHGCVTGAYAHAIADFFGTKRLSIRLFSRTAPLRPYADFDSTDDIIKEIIDARVYNGVHYRTSVVHGSVLAHKVSHWVTKHYFQPVDSHPAHGRKK
jgi:PAP2 superfamily